MYTETELNIGHLLQVIQSKNSKRCLTTSQQNVCPLGFFLSFLSLSRAWNYQCFTTPA